MTRRVCRECHGEGTIPLTPRLEDVYLAVPAVGVIGITAREVKDVLDRLAVYMTIQHVTSRLWILRKYGLVKRESVEGGFVWTRVL